MKSIGSWSLSAAHGVISSLRSLSPETFFVFCHFTLMALVWVFSFTQLNIPWAHSICEFRCLSPGLFPSGQHSQTCHYSSLSWRVDAPSCPSSCLTVRTYIFRTWHPSFKLYCPSADFVPRTILGLWRWSREQIHTHGTYILAPRFNNSSCRNLSWVQRLCTTMFPSLFIITVPGPPKKKVWKPVNGG